MNKKTLTLGVFIFSMVLGISLSAQPRHGDDFGDGFNRSHRPPKQMEALRIWKMTEYLNLSEDQAAKFFPALKIHHEEMDGIDSSETAIQINLRTAIESGNIDQKTVTGSMEQIKQLHKQRMTMENKFLDSLPEYLTPEQQAKYLMFDRRFRQALQDIMRRRGFMQNH